MRKIDLLGPGLDGDCNVVEPMTRTVAVTDDPQIGPALQYGHSQFTSIRPARADGAGAIMSDPPRAPRSRSHGAVRSCPSAVEVVTITCRGLQASSSILGSEGPMEHGYR